MPKLQDLHEKRLNIHSQMKELANRGEQWTAEDKAKWQELNAQFDATQAEVDAENKRLQESKAIQERLQEIEEINKAALNDNRVGLDETRRRQENPENVAKIDVRGLAFQGWLRAGRGLDLTKEQRDACRAAKVNPTAGEIELSANITYGGPAWATRDGSKIREFRVGLDITNAGAGQETIPQGFMAELEAVTLAYAQLRNVCRVWRTPNGNTIPWPKVDDTGNSGVKLDEATTIGTSVDPTFSSVSFTAYKYSSKPVFVSAELLMDSAFDLSREIAGMLGERLGRIEASAMTTGDGTGDPNGIVTAAGTGKTTSSATAFTADEILDLIHSLDPSNRIGPSVGFQFHDTALLYIRKLKDANGAYLWNPGLQSGEPNTLCGFPYFINQQMEPLVNGVPVTAKKHVLFGDFSKYVIRVAGPDRFYRLDERYRDLDQSAFIAFRRLDGDTIKASALKVLLQA